MILNVLKVFGLSSFAFFAGVLITPVLTHYLYKYKMWRKKVRRFATDGAPLGVYQKLQSVSKETRIPRFGGIIVWSVPLMLILIFYFIPRIFPENELFAKLNFLSRSQTWLPLFTIVASSLVGLADDIMQVFGRGKFIAGGMRLSRRLGMIILIAGAGAWWFFVKLGVSSIIVPFYGEVGLGILFPLFFVLVMIATFSGGVIDGIDGLSGGVLAASYSAYAGIAFFQNQIDLAAFSAVIVGAILSFLWFNIPPARFYMGESGIMGLTTTLTVIAFLTDAVLVLPLIALPLVVSAASSLIQLLSKRLFGRKVFIVAPFHHHLEALGWPFYKVTMRYWVVGVVFSVIGMVIALIG